MAKKFLPFVTETTNPLDLYKAIINNGKGCHYRTIGAVFYVIMVEGISEVRQKLGVIPHMEGKDVYTDILHKYGHSSDIKDHCLLEFMNICFYLDEDDRADWPKALKTLSMTNVFTFLYVMTVCKKIEEVTKLRLDRLTDNTSFDGHIANMEVHLLFSDTALPVRFDGPEDLRRYILCERLLKGGNNSGVITPYFETLKEDEEKEGDESVPF